MMDVDAGQITTETDLALVEGRDPVTPAFQVGEPLLKGENYLEQAMHIDPYDSKEIMAALIRQMHYKTPKVAAKIPKPAPVVARASTTKGGSLPDGKEATFTIADYSTMEPDAIKWVNWFRNHCPNMRVAVYKKYALALLDANIATTGRLKLRMEDDPFLLVKRLGFDRYDVDEIKSAAEKEDTIGNAMNNSRVKARFSSHPSSMASGPSP